MAKKGAIFDLTGMRFGQWHVLGLAKMPFREANGRSHGTRWWCECACGKVKSVAAQSLRNGDSGSCGCVSLLALRSRSRTHGMTRTPLYRIWSNIKRRTSDPKSRSYRDYGGRGIRMCDEWFNDFSAFYSYVGDRPSAEHSLDRINNDRGYEPGNVRWVLKVVQANNTRSNRMITISGVTKTLSMWCRDNGVDYKAAHARLRAGWTEVAAVTTPVRSIAKRSRRVGQMPTGDAIKQTTVSV